MRIIKNWYLAFIGYFLIILDLGFNEINPILIEIGLNSTWISVVKIGFGIYGVWRLKKQLPTQNKEKLKEIIKGKNG
jgi:hypothetical protein